MDNSKYPLGTDLYLVNHGGNTITSWDMLSRWARFVYLRASIGQVADGGFVEAARAAKEAGLLVGAYHELWPDLNLTWQANTFQGQINKISFPLDLPPAIAFEKQALIVKFKTVPTYPNPTDILGMAGRISDLKPILYVGLDGLNIIKDAGFNFAGWRFWIARYMAHPGRDGEMGVDDTLELIGHDYGIDKSQVLFMQTAQALPYPPGISPDKDADYDRAVSFPIIPQPPLPVPDPVPAPQSTPRPEPMQPITITVQSNDPQTLLKKVMQGGQDKSSASSLIVIAPPVIPQPAKPNRFHIKFDWELEMHNFMSRTAMPDWKGNPITPATVRINGVRSTYNLTDRQQQAVQQINAPYPGAFKYVTNHAGGWVNNEFWPKVECLTFEGNIFDVLDIDEIKGRAFIRVWNGELVDECVIHSWLNIGNKRQPDGSYPIYRGSWRGPAFIILAYEPGAWVDLDILEKLPS